MKFVPCTGKCTDEGTHCEGCGRTHKEIAEMRKPVEALVALAEKMKYENTDDFANAVAGRKAAFESPDEVLRLRTHARSDIKRWIAAAPGA